MAPHRQRRITRTLIFFAASLPAMIACAVAGLEITLGLMPAVAGVAWHGIDLARE